MTYKNKSRGRCRNDRKERVEEREIKRKEEWDSKHTFQEERSQRDGRRGENIVKYQYYLLTYCGIIIQTP